MVDISVPDPGGLVDAWGPVLNTALTTLETAVTDNATSLSQLSFNVKDYGAAGTGAVNDSTEAQAAIAAAAAAGGGEVFFPPGTYSLNITVPSNVTLVGAGREATELRRAADGTPVVDMSGPSADATGATHVKYAGIRDLTINGNGLTGTALRTYYANNLAFERVFLTSSTERLVDGVELWDTRFSNCQFESSGGTNSATLPAVHLRNASSATPGAFGYSTDNTNQVVFSQCRWENFHNGALRVEDGSVVGNNPNGIYLVDSKMETSQMQGGSHLFVDDSCIAIWVDRLYCYAGGFAGGFSTAQNVIDWSASRSTLENVLLSNGGTATISSGVVAFSPSGQRSVLRNITSSYGTAPTGNHLFFVSSTGAWNVQNCYSGTGSQFGGTIPTAFEGTEPIKQVAGVVSDASFVRTPLNGTFAVDTTTNTLYLRVGGTWRTVALT